ncbi:MAG: molecular chaperone TorD family protein [Chloroflexi bacterium]|nr:molecular chaperone TorD family protein [Chloroflexota bacterium]
MASTGTCPEIAGLAEARSRCYSLLSASFSMPTRDLVRVWMDVDAAASLFGEEDLLPVECPGWEEMKSFVGREQGEEGLLEELSHTYVRLFFASPHFVAPPYESVYVEGGFVMGETAVKVSHEYSRESLDLSPCFKDLPDHIAVELEFMAFLSRKEAACWDWSVPAAIEQIAREEAFLREHVCLWLTDFSRRLEKAGEPFYSAVGRITDSFARVDLLRLSALRRSLSAAGYGPG